MTVTSSAVDSLTSTGLPGVASFGPNVDTSQCGVTTSLGEALAASAAFLGSASVTDPFINSLYSLIFFAKSFGFLNSIVNWFMILLLLKFSYDIM